MHKYTIELDEYIRTLTIHANFSLKDSYVVDSLEALPGVDYVIIDGKYSVQIIYGLLFDPKEVHLTVKNWIDNYIQSQESVAV